MPRVSEIDDDNGEPILQRPVRPGDAKLWAA